MVELPLALHRKYIANSFLAFLLCTKERNIFLCKELRNRIYRLYFQYSIEERQLYLERTKLTTAYIDIYKSICLGFHYKARRELCQQLYPVFPLNEWTVAPEAFDRVCAVLDQNRAKAISSVFKLTSTKNRVAMAFPR